MSSTYPWEDIRAQVVRKEVRSFLKHGYFTLALLLGAGLGLGMVISWLASLAGFVPFVIVSMLMVVVCRMK